jgi:membrane protein implicated in regulation of membrane protease activity
VTDWGWWLLLALALGAAEVFTLDLFFAMAALAAAIAAAAAFAGAGIAVQFGVFVLSMVLLLAVIRPIAMRHLRKPEMSTNTDALIGAEAFVVEVVDARDGRVKLGGEIWSARSQDQTVHPVGVAVRVVRIDGATAVIAPSPQSRPLGASWSP